MLRSGFFNSQNHDRMYNATDFNELISTIKSDGIDNYGDKLEVSAGQGLSVLVSTGKCFFNNHWLYNDSAYQVELEEASIVAPRIDAIVVEVNDTERDVFLKSVSGNPSNTPVPPTLIDSGSVHQHLLAYVDVAKEASAIGDITDERSEWADIKSERLTDAEEEINVLNEHFSHIGMVIHSTTLNTEAKVKAIYGANTQWISLSGYVLRGATSGVIPNNDAKDLGSDEHTITQDEMPSHYHSVSRQLLAESAGSHSHYLLANGSSAWILKNGGNEGMSSFAGYKNTPTGVSSTQSAGAHTHYISAHNTNSTGSGTAMSIIPNEKNVYIWERVG